MRAPDLIQALRVKQAGPPKLRDEDFAAELQRRGVEPMSRQYWSLIRVGRRDLTDRLIRRVRKAYPDLEPLCIAALLSSDGDDRAA